MRVRYHPRFAGDIRTFANQYEPISQQLALRFRREIGSAIEAIKKSPMSAGHILRVNAKIETTFRRRNLRGSPFFILYGVTEDGLFFGSVVPSRSDPLTWLSRFR